MEQKKTEKFEINLPLLSVMVLILGLLKQILFYGNYNVPIKYFIGISEIGALFSEDLVFILLAFISIILFTSIRHNEPLIPSGAESQIENGSSNNSLTKWDWAIVIYVLISIVGIIILLFIFRQYPQQLLISILFLLLVFPFIESVLLNNFSPKLSYALIFCYFLVVAIILKTVFDIDSVTRGKYSGTAIKIGESKELISRDSLYFIGKTDKYIFFYNSKDTVTEIYPTEAITSFKLKSKGVFFEKEYKDQSNQ